MKEITMKSMLAWYGGTMFIGGVTGIYLAGALVYTTIPFIIVFVLTPLLSSMIALKVAVGKKKLRPSGKENIQLLTVNIISLALAYAAIIQFDIVLVGLFVVGGVLAQIYSSKKVANILNGPDAKKTTEYVIANDTPIVDDYTKILEEPVKAEKNIVKKYTLPTLRNESVRDFLIMNGLNADDYIYATIVPGLTSTFLMGSVSVVGMVNYIIAFDKDNIYMFELSRLSNKTIEDCLILDVNAIKDVKTKSVLFGVAKRIVLTFKDNQKVSFQANKKIHWLKDQNASIEKFVTVCRKNII